MEPIIKVKNIGKKYTITHEQGGYIALRDVLMNILKSPLKFFRQKAKEIVGVAKKEEFWALRNIDFEVKKGEVIGIIGRNGAGKSTLLKILSQITPPTEGNIIIQGRVGSLLEVGTGFHPELTGRENIFLNGAILGMTKKEIVQKFDQIVEFAGIEKFLDTPVKHYSSGMYVRLAFSVAAHMEPDILIIDEVLAVGDAEFQKKCLGKMDEITKKEGRTILFVSHNMSAIESLCQKIILLENGQIKKSGKTREVIDFYLDRLISTKSNVDVNEAQRSKDKGLQIRFSKCEILNSEKIQTNKLKFYEPFSIDLELISKENLDNLRVSINIETAEGQPMAIALSDSDYTLYSTKAGEKLCLRADFNNLFFTQGIYWVSLSLNKMDEGEQCIDQVLKIRNFEVLNIPHQNANPYTGSTQQLYSTIKWEDVKNDN